MIEYITKEEYLKQLDPTIRRLKISDRLITAAELPITGFDIVESLSNRLSDFGVSIDFDRHGEVVLYTGNVKITDSYSGEVIDMNNSLGVIVAQSNGRVIIHTDYGFFGWLLPDNLQKVNQPNTYSTLTH